MPRIILVTGGTRSGKTAHAQRMAEAIDGPRTYLATCVPADDEMHERIRRHRADRAEGEGQWLTVEEPVELAGAVRDHAGPGVLLIDCLSLWISNLMMRAHDDGTALDEARVEARCRELCAACARVPGTVILVTSEVGLGIVPDNAVARLYRDLLGRCNQTMAAAAHTVTLITCGIPLTLKNEAPQ